MPASRLRVRGTAAMGLALLLAAVGTASANHGGDSDHLPPLSKNMELVSKLEPSSQGAVTNNQIGDLAVHKGFAYLQSGSNCETGKGGFYVVDIRNPAAPSEANFTPALPNTYHGEGAQAIAVDTPAFAGDLLAVNNESCPGPAGSGGFDLYDISNPATPVPLVRGFGDGGGEGTLTGTATDANDSHSIFIWDAGDKAYAVIVDNEELHSVDIFDITNPASPQPVREYDLLSETPAPTDSPKGNDLFLADMVVKNIGGKWMLLAAYNDAGYIQMDVTNPADAQYVSDTDFTGTDPLTGFAPPEGNANYAEYSYDNRYLVTAEEDLLPFRVEHIDIDDAGRRDAATVPGGTTPNYLIPDGRMNGPAAYVGYACDDSAAVPTPESLGMTKDQPDEEFIAVIQRGPAFDPDEDYDGDTNTDNDPDDACFPGEKAANADDAGWDAVLIVNRHTPEGAAGDGVNCGSGAFDRQIVAVCTTHAAFHELFDDPVEYTTPYDDSDVPAAGDSALPAEGPNIGDQAPRKVSAEGLFDGWGYMSLYSTTPDQNGKMPRVDSYAIPEAMNPAYATGFGELSIREQATDPTEPLSYSSYRSGGMRVFSFESGKITPQGAFIDEGGNDMWGAEQFTSGNGERLIAGSDRDFGLYIVRYTGPLAPKRPSCSDTSAAVPSQGSVDVSLACSDANGNTLTRRIVSGPSAGSLGPVNQASGIVTYTNSGQAGGTDSFRFEASDGAASSAPATATISITTPPDTTPPDTTLTKKPKNLLESSKATYEFTSTESGSSFECKLDRKEYKPCSSPKKLTRLKPGTHKFKVRAIDAAGNPDPEPAEDKFRVV